MQIRDGWTPVASTLALTGAYTLDTYYRHARNMGQRATCLAVVFDGTLLHHESVRLDPLFANLRATSSARSRHQWRCHYHTGHGGYFNLDLDFVALRCVLPNIGPFQAHARLDFVVLNLKALAADSANNVH